jgi:hypothetical protein
MYKSNKKSHNAIDGDGATTAAMPAAPMQQVTQDFDVP